MWLDAWMELESGTSFSVGLLSTQLFLGLQYSLALLTSSACSSILLGEQVTNNAQAYISIPLGSQMGLEELNSVSKFPLMHSD